MANKTIRPTHKGLSFEELSELTLLDYRQNYLEALVDGELLHRTDPGVREIEGEIYEYDAACKAWVMDKGLTAKAVTTTHPTINHMSAALGIAISSLRSYEDGSASPRWEIGPMCDFAAALGLTVEQLNLLCKNSAKAGARRRVKKFKG